MDLFRKEVSEAIATIERDAALLDGAVEVGNSAEDIRERIAGLRSKLRALLVRIDAGPSYGLQG